MTYYGSMMGFTRNYLLGCGQILHTCILNDSESVVIKGYS